MSVSAAGHVPPGVTSFIARFRANSTHRLTYPELFTVVYTML